MGGMKFKYIDKKGEEHLRTYAYHGNDLSILSKVMRPFWEVSVRLLPLWIAPNLVTFLGFLFIIAMYGATVAVCGDGLTCAAGETQPWIYLFTTFCLFAYQTLDAVDGK